MDLVRKKEFFVVINRSHLRKEVGSFDGTKWNLRWLPYSGILEISRNNCSKSVEFQLRLAKYVCSGFLIQGQLNALMDISILRLKGIGVVATLTITENSQNIANCSYGSPAMCVLSSTNATVQTFKLQQSISETLKSVNANKSSTSLKVSKDLFSLLNNPDSFPDATLKCGTSEIQVHKCILYARSPVFEAMFRNHMQESLNNMNEIVDVDPAVLQSMLTYIYSGKTDHLNEALARDMLYAADKYQLEELKTICVDVIIANMAVSNVVDCLLLGDMHDKRLKEHAKEFICKCKKFSEIGMEEWETVRLEHPHLAVEVLMSVVEYVQENSICNL